MNNQIQISIVILTKDRFELIDNCLQSLLDTCNRPDIEVLLGDTGSSDRQVYEIYQSFGRRWQGVFHVTQLPSYHFSKNNNDLASHAQGKFLLFLNNDTAAVSTNWAAKLLSSFAENPQVGIIGAKLLYAHNHRIQHAGVEFIRNGPLRHLGYHPYRNRHSLMPEVCIPKYMPAVTGAFLCMPKHFFEEIGGFTESYAQEVQDVDLCMKALEQGKKCLYQPEITFFHLENGTRILGEENIHDRQIFQKKWSGLINQAFFTSPFQSTLIREEDQAARKTQPRVLVERAIARGDVLATAAIVALYRENNPGAHITFKTAYPELVDSYPFIDRVLHTSDIDDFSYDKEVVPGYEGGNWRKNAVTWLEEMAACFSQVDAGFPTHRLLRSVQDGSFSYPVPRNSMVEQDKADFYRRFFRSSKHIAISTGAGWPEREWTPAAWDHLAGMLTDAGYKVVQIGGGDDYRVQGALQLLNRSLQENYSVLKSMEAFVTLDSYPLHIAIAARIPIIVLTCKTCANTVFLPSNAREIRHRGATDTPLAGCRFLGCRQKFGDGRDNPCPSPILKQLGAEYVMGEIVTAIAGTA
ncbi:MAG: glycosyltransferase [Thermodesulfobacteriota bacterium]